MYVLEVSGELESAHVPTWPRGQKRVQMEIAVGSKCVWVTGVYIKILRSVRYNLSQSRANLYHGDKVDQNLVQTID